MKLQENYVNYVRNSVNVLVRDTGFPVLAKSLTEAGIANRKQLKVLVKKGHLNEMKVRVQGGTIFNAYFTETEPPRKFIEQANERKKAMQFEAEQKERVEAILEAERPSEEEMEAQMEAMLKSAEEATQPSEA